MGLKGVESVRQQAGLRLPITQNGSRQTQISLKVETAATASHHAHEEHNHLPSEPPDSADWIFLANLSFDFCT